jgi:hypothetical protein
MQRLYAFIRQTGYDYTKVHDTDEGPSEARPGGSGAFPPRKARFERWPERSEPHGGSGDFLPNGKLDWNDGPSAASYERSGGWPPRKKARKARFTPRVIS